MNEDRKKVWGSLTSIYIRGVRLPLVLSLLSLLLSLVACGAALPPGPDRALMPRELGVIVNRADPLSVQIGEYYRQRRRIPDRNLIEVDFPPDTTTLSPGEFRRIQRQVARQTPYYIQAYALTWATPYRVGCMSITSAFAFGFDPKYCAQGCQATESNPYFNQDSEKPYSDFGMRPTMAIAATTFAKARTLIDRGIQSDFDRPMGTAYLVSTSDPTRNVRVGMFPLALGVAAERYFAAELVKTDALVDKTDVMFYFTGLTNVQKLTANRFLPGAIADHLTSFGGMLTDSSQMSSLRWLEAGATGSYGTVEEPCNFAQKFPHPAVLMHYYLRGESLIEAYWKSVAWPGQGLFIGEPLARPFQ